jgi:hypothetical protein
LFNGTKFVSYDMTGNGGELLVHDLAKVGVEGSNPFARSN